MNRLLTPDEAGQMLMSAMEKAAAEHGMTLDEAITGFCTAWNEAIALDEAEGH